MVANTFMMGQHNYVMRWSTRLILRSCLSLEQYLSLMSPLLLAKGAINVPTATAGLTGSDGCGGETLNRGREPEEENISEGKKKYFGRN